MRRLAAWVSAAVLAASATARADEPTKQEPQPQAQSGEPSPKRALPNYDGRGPVSEDDPALWPLRVILSPLYFTSEYILRQPLGALTRAAERAKIPEKLYDVFAFGPGHKIGWAPVGLVEFGFLPSVGVFTFWNGAFTDKNNLTLHYEIWPTDWYAGNITDRWSFDKSTTLQFRFSGFKRPDQVFYGLGPESAQYHQSRFTEARFDASARLERYVWRMSRLEIQGGVRKADLAPGHFGSDPSLEVEAATGAFEVPFGFNRGYLAPYGRAYASLDTRKRNATTGSGARFEAQAEGGGDVEHAPASGWLRWGGSATAFADMDEHGRILSFALAAAFADPIGDEPIPYTELVMLGGDNWLHGFYPGRLRDRSAAVGQVQYVWPVAPWLNGNLQAAVGNVFGAHLEGFDMKLLRFSGGIGLTTTLMNPPIEVLVAFGTDTFDRGASIDSFRVSFGVPRLF